jgi:hypothetical protein
MSEERNSVPAWILQLQIASGGSLFVAGICFYGGFTLTNPNGPALFIPGFVSVFVAWIGWLVARIVKKQEVRLNRLEEERRIPGNEPINGDIQGKNAEPLSGQ